jgi:hydrogenase nickel incorporation protein HypB
MFQRSRYALITKTDLLPYLDFDVHRAIGYLRDVNPDIEILLTSARTSEGLDSWYEVLRAHVRAATHIAAGA